jgi:integrase
MANRKGSRRTTGAVRQLPSGRWQARVRDPLTGQLVAIGTYKDKRAADDAVGGARVEQSHGEWVAPEMKRVTVEAWAERWYATTAHLRPNTRASYRMLLDTRILPTLGRLELAEIDTMTVRSWLAELHAANLARATVAKCYRLLRQVLQAAVEAGRLAKNPCTVRGAASEPKVEMRCPTVEEIVSLADVVDERYRALVLLAGLGGLRWGELAGLRRSHVDLLHRTVTVAEQVTESMDGKLHVGPPKSEAGIRTVALPAVVVTALDDHLGTFAEPASDGLVFTAPEGGYLRRNNFGRRVWRPATQRAGLDGLRFHDLRHGAATLAAMTGATTKELMARIGHSSPSAALRYQHAVSGRDAAIASALDAMVSAVEPADRAPVAEVNGLRSGTNVARRASRRRAG